jgi:hypothetical protein
MNSILYLGQFYGPNFIGKKFVKSFMLACQSLKIELTGAKRFFSYSFWKKNIISF